MTLRIELTVGKSELLVQENPLCAVTLANAGDESLRIPHPGITRNLPFLRVMDAKTGEEELHRRPLGGRILPQDQTLQPGERTSKQFFLRDHAGDLPPGEYDLSAIWPPAESAAVRIKVLAATPRNLALDTVQGCVSYGVWASGSTIVRSRFEIEAGRVGETRSIAKADPLARPAISLPPNGADRERHWIAWIEGRTMRFTHVSPDRAIAPVGEFALPAAEAKIVAPMHDNPGCALLCAGERLWAVRLAPGEAAVTASLQVPRPVWMTSLARSNGSRAATMIRETRRHCILSSIAWSDESFEAPAKLAEWEGTFLGAGATMDFEDAIRGCIALGDRVVEWTVDRQGSFREKIARPIPWSVQAEVRVSRNGKGVALLRDGKGAWSLDGRPLRTMWPLDVAFLENEKPVVIAAEPGNGFRLLDEAGHGI